MPYKIKHKIQADRVDPKDAVPETILEQYPWHWDPTEKGHTDHAAFAGNIKFDWKSLGEWAIKKINDDRVPQKYWWWDDKEQAVMHASENVNSYPIYKQAYQHVRLNNFNEHNTQYFKYANEELGEFYKPLKEMFPSMSPESMGVSLFIQLPGQTIPCHVDTYSTYIRRVGGKPDYKKLRRYMIFVRDWDFGHFFHWGNTCINQWQAGDFWSLRNGIYHGSANAGVNPKITIHWSGEVEE